MVSARQCAVYAQVEGVEERDVRARTERRSICRRGVREERDARAWTERWSRCRLWWGLDEGREIEILGVCVCLDVVRSF